MLALLSTFAFAGASPAPTDECAFRTLTYEYALAQQPERAPLLDVFDALELATRCDATRPAPVEHRWPSFSTPSDRPVWIVSVKGSDDGDGSLTQPFRTVGRALVASRAAAEKNGTILLRAGVHYLSQTIELDGGDSGLTIQNYEGEEAWLSGGAPLQTNWTRWQHPSEAKVCAARCKAEGHCCEGTTSSYNHPSCAMGCLIAGAGASSLAECEAGCQQADGKCEATVLGLQLHNCGACPAGCDASDGVGECVEGCRIAFGVGGVRRTGVLPVCPGRACAPHDPSGRVWEGGGGRADRLTPLFSSAGSRTSGRRRWPPRRRAGLRR
jgi:hypothetical protein